MLVDRETYTPGASAPRQGSIPCYDPSTMQLLGHTKAMTPAEVRVNYVASVLWAATCT